MILAPLLLVGAYYIYESEPWNPDLQSFWPGDLGAPIEEKIYPYPNYWHKPRIQDESGAIVDVIPVQPTNLIREHFNRAFSKLPGVLLQIINTHLQGIYLLDNLPSSGMAFPVQDGKEVPQTYVILIDVSKCMKNLNEWSSFRELTVFPGMPTSAIQCRMSNSGKEISLDYLLYHELGHVFGWITGEMPPYNNRTVIMNYPYVNISWDFNGVGKEFYKSESAKAFSLLEYYAISPPYQPGMGAVQAFGLLRDSSFNTLYSTQDLEEDFAENFALYFWCHHLGHPYDVKINEDGRVLTLDVKKKFLASTQFAYMDLCIKKCMDNQGKADIEGAREP